MKNLVDITIDSLEQMPQAAQQFVQAMGESSLFAFYGGMGVGKTTFIKAVCAAMGVTDVVTSPTFSIVNEYLVPATGQSIFHFDFYRIKKIDEVLDLGFEDYLERGALCFMEWPELVEPLLPDDTVRVDLAAAADGARTLHVEPLL